MLRASQGMLVRWCLRAALPTFLAACPVPLDTIDFKAELCYAVAVHASHLSAILYLPPN